LLYNNQINPLILYLDPTAQLQINSLDITLISDKILLTGRILTINRTTNSLVAIYKQIELDLENPFAFENKLLLYYDLLIVLDT
jgi:hypothetical protein